MGEFTGAVTLVNRGRVALSARTHSANFEVLRLIGFSSFAPSNVERDVSEAVLCLFIHCSTLERLENCLVLFICEAGVRETRGCSHHEDVNVCGRKADVSA